MFGLIIELYFFLIFIGLCPYFIFLLFFLFYVTKVVNAQELHNTTRRKMIKLIIGLIIILFCLALITFFMVKLLFARWPSDFKNIDVNLWVLNNLIIEAPGVKIYQKMDYNTAYNYVDNFIAPGRNFYYAFPNTRTVAEQYVKDFATLYSNSPTNFDEINIKLRHAWDELCVLAQEEWKNSLESSKPKPKSHKALIVFGVLFTLVFVLAGNCVEAHYSRKSRPIVEYILMVVYYFWR